MIVEWFFGFHLPRFRNFKGRIDPRYWFGHCEAWGYNADDTWIFIEPESRGLKIKVLHRYDEVVEELEARFLICNAIVKVENQQKEFSLPPATIMTCAALCGALVATRALIPKGLKRKLLKNGAELVHERKT